MNIAENTVSENDSPVNHTHLIPELAPDILKRFWAKVDKNGPIPTHRPELGKCWVWTAGTCRGYGKFRMGGHIGKLYIATRVSYFAATGIQPDLLHTLHHCDNPPCVNPAHLFLGTDLDNVHDAISKGRNYLGYKIKPRPLERTARGVNSGAAKLTEENVLEIVAMLQRGVTHNQIAEKFGVRGCIISHIKNGKNWTHLTGIKRTEYNRKSFVHMNTDRVLEIKRLIAAGLRNTEIAAMFNCVPQNISKIRCGKSWPHLT